MQAPPDMPVGRNHAASCTDGTNLYSFGGRDGGNVVGPGFAETQVLSPGAPPVCLAHFCLVHLHRHRVTQ